MEPFEEGDQVRCVDAVGTRLVAGKTYTVESSNDTYIQLTVDGMKGGYAPSRFVLAEGPVREVTRKEIVPGVYGIIDVPPQDEINDRVFIEGLGRVNAAELRAAAATFIEIADALEPTP